MRKILIFALLAALLLSGCAAKSAPAATEPPVTEPAETEAAAAEKSKFLMPDFTVYDLEGNEVHLSDFRGKPVVLNFWASWCGPCKSEMPDFNEKYQELGDKVQFLMINLTDGSYETLEKATSYVESQGYTFPVFYDTASNAAYTYGISSIPTTFFIDAEGCGITYASGAINGDTLQRGIDLIYTP